MRTSKNWISLLLCMSFLLITSCETLPEKAVPVTPFNKERYLGKWYEIARLDFKYEKDLNNTTAEYSLQDDGSIKVDNKGYNTVKKEWQQAIGKAKFVGNENIARLKVSFFGPFYSGYNVIALDPEYRYALVAGKNLKYLWILSRDITIPNDVKKNYLAIAEGIGYRTADLIWVAHDNSSK